MFYDSTNVSHKTLNKMDIVNKLRDFVASEVLQGYERCSVVASSSMSDVVYIHVDDISLSFSFLSRLAVFVSPRFEIFCNNTGASVSFDIQFTLE